MDSEQIPRETSLNWAPAPAMVRDELENVLGSQTFRQSTRISAFLRFTVGASVRGDISALKETVLGVQVFNRAPNYDPKSDPIVRVTAARLRAKLEEYYRSEGRFDRLRIEFPKGSYRPLFRPGSEPATSALPAEIKGRARQLFAFPAAIVYGRVLLGLAAAVLISVAAVTAYVVTFGRAETRVFHSVPLTSFRGHEMNPALSPDGQSVAFTWNGERQNNFDIYVMRLGSNGLDRLTFDPADDISPAWSPDGGTIAFVRRLGDERGELLLIPANGGPEHMIGKILNSRLNYTASTFISLSWSPDGRWIAASDRRPLDSSERIYLFSTTGDSRPLTSSPGYSGDHTPAFSPDGHKLAFSRLAGWSTSDIYELPLDASSLPSGDARRLTVPGRWCVHPAWLPNGRILYLDAREPGAQHELRTTGSSVAKANALRLENWPSEFTLRGDHLVYTHLKEDTNIYRARIPGSGEAPSVPELLIASTWRDEKPRFSPDGKKIAFVSWRSGFEEIWVARADGSSPVRVTSFRGPVVGYPAWSPDGQWLVFHARPEGQADVFAIPAAGGPPKRLTSHPADDVMPTYSPDGRWINFCSHRSGRPEIWRMPVAGGEPFQMTSSGGMQPFESDGKIFYLSGDGTRIRSVPVEGGPPSDVAGPLHPWPSGFAISQQGLYFAAPPHSGDLSFIRFFSFATREDRPVALANHGFYLGMTITPDEKYIAFDQFDEFDRDLMLVENFRP